MEGAAKSQKSSMLASTAKAARKGSVFSSKESSPALYGSNGAQPSRIHTPFQGSNSLSPALQTHKHTAGTTSSTPHG